MNNEKNTTETAAAAILPAETNANPMAGFLEASKKLAAMKQSFSIVPTYADIKKPQRFIFVGVNETTYTEVDKQTGEVVTKSGKVVNLVADGKLYVNRGVQLIRTFEDNKIAAGQAVEISLKEEVKNATTNGKTKIYDVVILA